MIAHTPSITDVSLPEQVERMFNQDFYFISLQLIKKAYPNFFEYIIYPDNYNFEDDHRIFDPWGKLYEAKSLGISNFLVARVNDLASIGILLLKVEELNTMMFIPDTGYDFYESHWIPLYRDILQWI